MVTAGVQALHPGQKVRLLGSDHERVQSLGMGAQATARSTVYLMIVAVAGRRRRPISGSAATRIRRSSSRPWWCRRPGRAPPIEDTLKQVTERLERKLQETPKLDFLRSFTRAGVTTIFVNLKGSATASEVPDIWYHVRKSIGDIRHTLPAGIVGPGFNDEFGDTFGIIYGFTADGFTHRELRDHVEDVRSKLLHVPDVSKIEILGAQDERIFVEFSMQELANLGIDRSALIAALQAQNVVQPGRHHPDRRRNALAARVGRVSSPSRTSSTSTSPSAAACSGSATSLRSGAAIADPPQPMFRVNGEPAIGLAIAMRDGGDILALGQNIKRAMAEITADLPLGIEPKLVADQAVTVESAIAEFMTSLWQAIAIILVVSFISLGVRPGLVIALAIPLTLAIVFSVMDLTGIDMQRISLGALIIALALLVDDAMTTTDAMVTRLAAGDDKVAGRDLRVPHLRLRHAGRHAGDDRRLRPGRLRGELRRRIHVLAFCRRRHRADRVLVRGGASSRRCSASRF